MMASVPSLGDIDCIVQGALKLFNVPGAAVGLVVRDQIVLSRGYGTCKVHEDLPVTERTLFPIGSCTKAFTALLLGQLVDEGKIAFDDPVIKYIPEFCLSDQNLAENLTIRDLLAHRTGIARHDPIWVYLEFPRSDVIELLRHVEPVCGLREKFQYNNFMYCVAGIVIERITGQSWEDAMSSRLLRPLGMKDSNLSLGQLKICSDFSFPHAEINGTVINIPFANYYAVNPAGGINSNIADMTKWVRFQLCREGRWNERIIQAKTLKELQTAQMPFSSSQNDDEDIYQLGYGLGWCIGNYRGQAWISHGGDTDGFSSDVTLLPEKGIGLVILTNSSSDGRYVISCIRNQIIDKILSLEKIDWIKKMQETRDKTKLALQESLERFCKVTQMIPLVHSLNDYSGSYEHPSYGSIELTIENDRLVASYGKMRLPLYFKSEGVFTGQSFVLLTYGIDPIIDFTFFKNALGNVCKIQVPFESFRAAAPVTFVRN